MTQPKRAIGVFKDILNSNLRSNDSIKFLTRLEISDYYRDEAIMDSALHYAISANLFANEKKRRDWAALSLLRIAKLYRGFELFEKAEDQLELVEAQISLAEYPEIWCQYLKSKALTEFEKGNNEACYLLMDSAIALAAEIGDSTMQEAFIMDKAMRYYGQGDLDNCMSIYDSLLCQDINLKLETTILHNVITIYLEQDQIQEADYMSQAFIELANESDKLDYIIQATYDRIMVLEEMGIYDEALNLYYALDGEYLLSQLETDSNLDVILMDIQMPNMDGIKATDYISKHYPHIKVIMLTILDSEQSIYEAIQAGAIGYLVKESNPQQLYDSIIETLEGGAAMSPEITAKAFKIMRNPDLVTNEKLDFGLSEREQDVLVQLTRGLNYNQIASNLIISSNTVRRHIENIYKKIEVHN